MATKLKTDTSAATPTSGDLFFFTDASDSDNLKEVDYADLASEIIGDITGLDAANISAGNVSNTEFDYLNGVTSAIQTQLDAKASSSHTHTASDITDFDTEVANNSAVTANTAKVTNATHTGDVTGSTALTIADDAVTYAKMQNVVSDNVLLGNNSGAGGIVDELTATEVRTLLNVEDGADVTDATNVAAAGAVMDGDFSSNGLMKRTGAGTYSVVTDNSTNRDTAYGRGDHGAAGYLTSATAASTYQPLDSDLTTIAGLTATTNNFIQSVSSAWASRTPTQVTATLDVFVGDSGSGGTKGLAPAPAAGDAAASKFLKADGTWSVPAGSGDVSKVGTPVDSQIGVWTGDGTIEGTAQFTRDNTSQIMALGVEDTTTYIQAADATTTDTNGGTLYLSGGLGDGTGNSGGVVVSSDPSFEAFMQITADLYTLYHADGLFSFANSTNEGILDFSNIATSDKTFTFPNTTGTVLIDADIGSSVQAYSANLTTLATAFTTASASGAASLAFAEDTDNGSNTATLIGPASIASNITITLPSATGTLATLAGTETLTNKTIDAAGTGNVLSNVAVSHLASSAVAVAADLNTGTSTSKLITPDALAGSNYGIEYFQCACFDRTTDVATGDGAYYVHIPPKLNGWNLIYVHARVITAGTTGTTDIQIHNVTDAADMLSTKITIDSTETGSNTAATAAVINGAADDVATNDLLRVDVDAVSTTKPKGLIVTLGFQLP